MCWKQFHLQHIFNNKCTSTYSREYAGYYEKSVGSCYTIQQEHTETTQYHARNYKKVMKETLVWDAQSKQLVLILINVIYKSEYLNVLFIPRMFLLPRMSIKIMANIFPGKEHAAVRKLSK